MDAVISSIQTIRVDGDDFEVSAEGIAETEINIAKSGYRPVNLSVVIQNAKNNGANYSRCALHSAYISGDIASIFVINYSSLLAKIYCRAYVTYIAD